MNTGKWALAHGRHLELGPKAVVMGILNVTPDSFSDGGRHEHVDLAVKAALRMREAGANIIDVGGESTRPGAAPVSAEIEQSRILPVIGALRGFEDIVISVDTYRAQTALLAVEQGAHIVNDVWGLQKEPEIARVAAQTGAGLVIMHNGRDRSRHEDVIEDQFRFLDRSLSIAGQAGVSDDQIVLDPGFGFAKDERENLQLMARFGELKRYDHPFAVGLSRKRFIGSVTGRDTAERDIATAATSALLRMQGAAIFRVHDVAANIDALKMADAMLAAGKKENACTRSD
ncbi:dihydropteroate synthase [Nitratireductor basaltis]|uniref:Dihydropteroate synthase n=1 Tax=Nitratireductor basaltis TaxID=472175 RepID=A0A084UB13_9HYPH|nr:dihydropteroate synthase [Nitratireductor basaltis]KFB10149.1 Dihydropteroate synthase [Nitratireductor basaltis]